MNKHIERVKKWLADNDSVSHQEISDTVDAAVQAAFAASCAVDDAIIAAEAASCAAEAADCAKRECPTEAAYWVKLYEIEIGGLNEPAA